MKLDALLADLADDRLEWVAQFVVHGDVDVFREFALGLQLIIHDARRDVIQLEQ